MPYISILQVQLSCGSAIVVQVEKRIRFVHMYHD